MSLKMNGEAQQQRARSLWSLLEEFKKKIQFIVLKSSNKRRAKIKLEELREIQLFNPVFIQSKKAKNLVRGQKNIYIINKI